MSKKTFKALNKITLEINGVEETFIAESVKVREYKALQKLEQKIQREAEAEYLRLREVYGEEMTTEGLVKLADSTVRDREGYEDVLIDLLVKIFGNKFTVDEFWDGLPLNKYTEVIGGLVNYIHGVEEESQSEKAREFAQSKGKR